MLFRRKSVVLLCKKDKSKKANMSSTKSKKKHLTKKTNPSAKPKKNQCAKTMPPALVDINDGVDSGHGDSDAASTTPLCTPNPVNTMTSREFQFDTCAHVEMLDQMLKDKVRIRTFKAAIMHNQHLFKGKYVLDIGCGIGIFSLFAAKAGAAKVFAVDTSNVIYYTREIVAANGYENVIEVFKGKIEDVELPVMEVDIIVSDWMGYALLFQSKCSAVIYARDKWLKPGGLIFPDQGKLFVVAAEDGKHKNENIEWWKNVYGFNMNCIREASIREPRHQMIQPRQVLSNQYPIKSIDLYTATNNDLGFRSKYMLPMQRSGRMDGIVLYFHVYFTKSHTPLGFSTDPWSEGTNWMQTIFFFDQSISVRDGSLYYGGIEFVPTKITSDVNDITVNIELLKGDPVQVDFEMEMSWRLKPTVTLDPEPEEINADNETKCLENKETNGSPDDIMPSIDKLSLNNNSNSISHTVMLNDQCTEGTNDVFITPLQSTVHSTTCLNWCRNNNNSSDCGAQSLPIGKHKYTFHRDRRGKNKHNKKGNNCLQSK